MAMGPSPNMLVSEAKKNETTRVKQVELNGVETSIAMFDIS